MRGIVGPDLEGCGMAETALRVRIRGRVQGVGYRAWAAWQAETLGLTGWVRNRADGTVEAVFSGPAEAVEDMVGRCATGPRLARVEAVERAPETAAAPLRFEQLPTL
jgi:acylphosphatase